jgi:hypothetical protein
MAVSQHNLASENEKRAKLDQRVGCRQKRIEEMVFKLSMSTMDESD